MAYPLCQGLHLSDVVHCMICHSKNCRRPCTSSCHKDSAVEQIISVSDICASPLACALSQLAVPGLEDRARFFPRIVSVRQQTPGFFDAPAAGLQPLGGVKLGPLEPLPEVIMVFCTIDK